MLKENVLRGKRTFDRIYKKGRSIGDSKVVLFYVKNGLPYNRTAFLASKKVGNSVKRNRARRLMKESYREIKDSFKDGFDIVFIARNTICGAKCADVSKSLTSAARRANVLKKKV